MKLKSLTNHLIYLLAALACLQVSCKKSIESPTLPSSSLETVAPLEGSFKLSSPDSLTWTEHPFPGMENLPTRPFSLETLESNYFEIENADSIRGKLKTKAINFDSLQTKPLNFDTWPQDSLRFKIKQLGKPTITEAGELSIDPTTSSGISKLDQNFGIEGMVTGVYKDSNGMLWFSVNNKIIKYDGTSLETYGSEQGLLINIAYTIFEDSRGFYWIGDANSISILDLENKLIYELKTKFRLPNNYHITEDQNGRIWLANNGVGFTLIDLQEKYLRQFTPQQGLISAFTVQVSVDDDGTVWLSSGGGINILDFYNYTNTLIVESDVLEEIGVAIQTKRKDGSYWIVTQNGVNILNKSKDTLTYVGTGNIGENFKNLTRMKEGKNGDLWIGSTDGYVHRIKWEDKVFKTYRLNPGPNNVVYNLVFDDNDQLWLCLLTGGAFVVDLKENQPTLITPEKGLGDPNVWATLQADDGKKWIGTYGGVDVIDLDNNTIRHLDNQSGLLAPRNVNIIEDSKGRKWLSSNTVGTTIVSEAENKVYHLSNSDVFNGLYISEVFEIEDDNFLLGTTNGKIFNLNFNTNTLKSIQIGQLNPDSNYNRISEFVKIDSNNVWVGLRSYGLFKWNLKANTLQKVTGDNLIDENNIFSIYLDKKKLWVATYVGMHLLDFSEHKTYTFTTKQGLPVNDIYDIIGTEDNIYAGSSLGLAILSQTEENKGSNSDWFIKTIGRQQGLVFPDFAQNSMSIDERGRLWAGVDSKALTVIEDGGDEIDSTNTIITGFSIYDNTYSFQSDSSLQLIEKIDTIYDTDGYNYTKATEYFKNKTKDSIGISYSGTQGAYDLPVELELPPEQNFLNFSYQALQFRDQDKLAYTYFLEGIDKNWSHVTTNTRTETYRDLAPGNYTFKVASKNMYSDWSKPAEFSFTILPNWWQTWWAKLLLVLFLSLLLWAITYYRSQWLKKENRILEEKVQVRTKQLRKNINQLKATQNQLIQSEKMASLGELTAGIAHEIQNPLNFVNNFSELNRELIEEMKDELKNGNYKEVDLIATDIKQNEDKILHHGKRADSIVKGMLQHSRSNTGERTKTDINLLADEYLRLAYHGLRAKDKSFNATLETDFDEHIGKISIVGQDIGRVVLNIINNALHAVRAKQEKTGDPSYSPIVKIATEKKSNAVEVRITDNGTGIPKHTIDKIFQPFFTTKSSGEGTGLGLSMSYDIIKAHGGELKVESEEHNGTTFIIVLPIIN